MKPLKPGLFIGIILICLSSSAQSLVLEKGNRTKSIERGEIISIQTSNPEGLYGKKNYTSLRGELISAVDDSVVLLVYTETFLISVDKKTKAGEVKNYDVDSNRFQRSIAKSDIKTMAVWGKHEKSIKNRQTWGRFGNVVAGLGAITPWFAYTSENNDTQNTILIVGISMMVAGTTSTMIAQPKILTLSNDLHKNKKKKVWQIQ
jgi:hypothetical protein